MHKVLSGLFTFALARGVSVSAERRLLQRAPAPVFEQRRPRLARRPGPRAPSILLTQLESLHQRFPYIFSIHHSGPVSSCQFLSISRSPVSATSLSVLPIPSCLHFFPILISPHPLFPVPAAPHIPAFPVSLVARPGPSRHFKGSWGSRRIENGPQLSSSPGHHYARGFRLTKAISTEASFSRSVSCTSLPKLTVSLLLSPLNQSVPQGQKC